ncbi:nitrile hydratase [Rhodomicrobium udaipurense JA643]|uniref:Nitrile hydratase subunit beta n=1 Tax=Rhodomicrobium udaipurense TaxID=1202716 RepID=A0A8I1GD37_9HYPH|nr:SH3-like domain-containing protein [Rhodomicrobium udaipurense]KAI96057.1 nitrile hydratase [Rhodomicrobium udaipurense JA643]MBJ7542734.1 nitrile hydratase subunit beta [Rhodomicrobium udaipurense]
MSETTMSQTTTTDNEVPSDASGEAETPAVLVPVAPSMLPVIKGNEPRFGTGDTVHVRRVIGPAYTRTPRYVMGAKGTISRPLGEFLNPDDIAYGRFTPKKMLYRVRFRQVDLWPDYKGPPNDTLEIELFEHWLTLNPKDKTDDQLPWYRRVAPGRRKRRA